MTALDIFVLLIVGGLGAKGFSKGFVTESLSLVAWVAGFVAVKLFHTPVSALLTDMVGSEGGASVLAVALLFGVTFAIGRIAANRIGAASKSSVMGPFDRVLGFGFGAFKGLLAASFAFLIASLGFDIINGGQADRPAWMTDSRTYPLLNATSRALVDFVGERRKGGVADGNMA
jgi:membrane protein required for colicin V production